MQSITHDIFWTSLTAIVLLSFQNGICDSKSSSKNSKQTNLIRNADFEKVDTKNDLPTDWKFFNSGGKKGSQGKGIRIKENSHSGHYCIAIEKTNRSSLSSWIQTVPASPLTNYQLTFRYKTTGQQAQTSAVIYCLNKDSKIIRNTSLYLKNSLDWHKAKKTITTVTGTVNMQVIFRIANAPGTLCIDNVSLIKMGKHRQIWACLTPNLKKINYTEVENIKKKAILCVEDHSFTGSGVGVKRDIHDKGAEDGKATSAVGTIPKYFNISWRIDNSITPALYYDIIGRIKIIGNPGFKGKAFRTGVYNSAGYYVVNDFRPPVNAVENNQWQYFKLASTRLIPGDFVYIASAGNEDVQEVRIDNIMILPGNAETRKFYDEIKANDMLRFSLFPKKTGSVSIVTENRNYKIGYIINNDKRLISNQSFAGIVIDYLSTDNKIEKRVFISLTPCGKNIKPGFIINVANVSHPIDEIIKNQKPLDKFQLLQLSLSKFAPSGWEGRNRLSFIVHDSLIYFSGGILSPTLQNMNVSDFICMRENKGRNKQDVNIDDYSYNFLKHHVRKLKFKNGIKKLKKLIEDENKSWFQWW